MLCECRQLWGGTVDLKGFGLWEVFKSLGACLKG